MNNKCKVTVVVISYNPVWEKLRNTLKSIVWQQNIDFEIIVADDGSENDCFDLVENFLKEKKFTNYKLIKNLFNQGIVKNVLSAVNVAEGKYIKLISPGDFLYDKNTLKEFIVFAEENPAAFYFGNTFYYYIDNNGIIYTYSDIKNPRDLRPWKSHNMRRIYKKYLVDCDYICGAAIMYNTQKFSKYLNEISTFVTFAEDCSMIYMIANKENAYYVNMQGCVWYEYGSGISTQKNDTWNQYIKRDNRNLFAHLLEMNLIPKWNYKILFSEKKIERRILQILHNPQSFFKKLFAANKVKGYENNNCNINKLIEILEQ